MLKVSTKQIRHIIHMQLVATVLVSALLLVINAAWFWSAVIGGLIATLANTYFAWKVFSRQQETSAEQILLTYYGAEVGKVILTVMLFAAVILMIQPLNIIALMGMYLFNQLTPLLVSFFSNEPD
jgi:ATP synthase protein I